MSKGYIYKSTSVWDYSTFHEVKIGANDGSSGDYYGSSIAICDDRVVVGAYGDKYKGVKSGTAYIYDILSDKSWEMRSKIFPEEGNDGDHFGWSVACDVNMTVVGAYGNDRVEKEAGAVFLYSENAAGKWVQVAALFASDGLAGDYFGWSVSIHNGVILVGAIGHDYIGMDSGLVYAFIKYISPVESEHSSTSSLTSLAHGWILEAVLSPNDGSPYSFFGWSLDMYNDVVIVGSPWTDRRQGSAYIFTRNVSIHDFFDDAYYQFEETKYLQQQKLDAPERNFRDFYGSSVSIYDNQIVIGAHMADNGDLNSGAVFIYNFNKENSQWIFNQKLNSALYKDQITFFGYSVDIRQGIVIVGAPGSTDSGNSSIHFFTENALTGKWILTNALSAKPSCLSPIQSDYSTHQIHGSAYGASVGLGDGIAIAGSDTCTGMNNELSAGAIFVYFPRRYGWGYHVRWILSQVSLTLISVGSVTMFFLLLTLTIFVLYVWKRRNNKRYRRRTRRGVTDDDDDIFGDDYDPEDHEAYGSIHSEYSSTPLAAVRSSTHGTESSQNNSPNSPQSPTDDSSTVFSLSNAREAATSVWSSSQALLGSISSTLSLHEVNIGSVAKGGKIDDVGGDDEDIKDTVGKQSSIQIMGSGINTRLSGLTAWAEKDIHKVIMLIIIYIIKLYLYNIISYY